MWHTVIVTSTEWSNSLLQGQPRCSARDSRDCRDDEEHLRGVHPQLVKKGEWHMPPIQPDEAGWAVANPENARKVSAARCARVSYLTYDGKRDVSKDLSCTSG